jgi:hypothetical protein
MCSWPGRARRENDGGNTLQGRGCRSEEQLHENEKSKDRIAESTEKPKRQKSLHPQSYHIGSKSIRLHFIPAEKGERESVHNKRIAVARGTSRPSGERKQKAL